MWLRRVVADQVREERKITNPVKELNRFKHAIKSDSKNCFLPNCFYFWQNPSIKCNCLARGHFCRSNPEIFFFCGFSCIYTAQKWRHRDSNKIFHYHYSLTTKVNKVHNFVIILENHAYVLLPKSQAHFVFKCFLGIFYGRYFQIVLFIAVVVSLH